MMKPLLSFFFFCFSALCAAFTPALAFEEPESFEEASAVSDKDLDTMRGGFSIDGVNIAIGYSMMYSIESAGVQAVQQAGFQSTNIASVAAIAQQISTVNAITVAQSNAIVQLTQQFDISVSGALENVSAAIRAASAQHAAIMAAR